MQATFSALIMACVENEQLERATELHQLMKQDKLHPDLHAYNALVNAYGCGSQVSPSRSAVCILCMDCFAYILKAYLCYQAKNSLCLTCRLDILMIPMFQILPSAFYK